MWALGVESVGILVSKEEARRLLKGFVAGWEDVKDEEGIGGRGVCLATGVGLFDSGNFASEDVARGLVPYGVRGWVAEKVDLKDGEVGMVMLPISVGRLNAGFLAGASSLSDGRALGIAALELGR